MLVFIFCIFGEMLNYFGLAAYLAKRVRDGSGYPFVPLQTGQKI